MTAYHCRIAIGHYARMLAEELGRAKAAPVAVLSYMWHYSADPFAVDVHVRVSLDDLAGFVSPASSRNDKSARLRQLVGRLHAVGALTRTQYGYTLHKPSVAELDTIARQQLTEPGAVLLGAAVQGPRTATEREVAALAKQERRAAEKEAKQRSVATLEALGKQRSDVRDALAFMLNVDKKTLRYSGKGSAPVQLAIDWLASTGATWVDFGNICKVVRHATAPNRPDALAWIEDDKPDLLWLFDPKHSAYLARIITYINEQVKT